MIKKIRIRLLAIGLSLSMVASLSACAGSVEQRDTDEAEEITSVMENESSEEESIGETETTSGNSKQETTVKLEESEEQITTKRPEQTTSNTQTTSVQETTTKSQTTKEQTTKASTTKAPTTSVKPTITKAPTTTKAQTTQKTTTKTHTTQPPTTKKQETTTKKYRVDYGSEESVVTSDYKYGLKKNTVTVNYYVLYSDGSKEVYDTSTYDRYDSSGYTATDAELLEESNAIATQNMAYYNEVLALVNEIRAEAGVQPLTLDTTLCQAATMRSLEMNYSQQFSHTRPSGETCFSVFHTYGIGYGTAGENIAAGQRTPESVVNAWENSQGHYENMINANFNKLGVGMSNMQMGYGIYWTQLFTD